MRELHARELRRRLADAVTKHHPADELLWPEQDIAAFLLARGPSALIGYGWWQCATMPNPFERPALLDADFGEPQGYCAETAPGSGVFSREWTRATVSLDCGAAFEATFAWKP